MQCSCQETFRNLPFADTLEKRRISILETQETRKCDILTVENRELSLEIRASGLLYLLTMCRFVGHFFARMEKDFRGLITAWVDLMRRP